MIHNDSFYLVSSRYELVSIDAKTGNERWRNTIFQHNISDNYMDCYCCGYPEYALQEYSEFPQIYGEKLYISSFRTHCYGAGMRVYNAITGRFTGVDKSINYGVSWAHSIIYKDKLIFWGRFRGSRFVNGSMFMTAIQCK